jgi:NAD(P)-dependent dehydrogenase (short-subunit alcohol dehydrogenase family)
MSGRAWGRIEFVSSESALQVPVEMIHYAVSKAANVVGRGAWRRRSSGPTSP